MKQFGAFFISGGHHGYGIDLSNHLKKDTSGKRYYQVRIFEVNGKLIKSKSFPATMLKPDVSKEAGFLLPKIIGYFERCILDKSGYLGIVSVDLYKACRDWCEKNSERPYAQRLFGIHLQNIGVGKDRMSKARYWTEIGMRE